MHLIFSLLLSFAISQTFASLHFSLTPNTQPFILNPLITPYDLLAKLETLPSTFTDPLARSRKLRNNRVVHLLKPNNDGCNPQSWAFEASLGGIKTNIELDFSCTSPNNKPEEKLFILQRSEVTKWKQGLTHESIEDVKEGCVKGTTKLDLGKKQVDVRVLKCTANIASYEAVLPSCIRATPKALLDLQEKQKMFSIFFFPRESFGVLSLGGPFLDDSLDRYSWTSTSHLPSSSSSGLAIMVTEVKAGRFTKLLEYRPAVLLPAFPFVYVTSSFELERLYLAITGAVKLAKLYPEYLLLLKKGWDVWGVPCWEGQKVDLKFGEGWQQVDPRGPRVRSGGGVCLGVFVAKVGSNQESGGVGQWVLGWPAMRGAEWVMDIERERVGFMRAEAYQGTEIDNQTSNA